MLLRTPPRVAVSGVTGKTEEKRRHNKHCLFPDLLRGLQGVDKQREETLAHKLIMAVGSGRFQV